MTEQVGRRKCSVYEHVIELGCDWPTINDTDIANSTDLVEHPTQIADMDALGLDQTLFADLGRWRWQLWSPAIVDVRRRRLLDVMPGRSSAGACAKPATPEQQELDALRWASLDMSGPWRLAFTTMLHAAVQVADPFHLVKLANTKLDEFRRRLQHGTLGHRDHRIDLLQRFQWLRTKAAERLDDRDGGDLPGLLKTGDPVGDGSMAWHPKRVVGRIYANTEPDVGLEIVTRLGAAPPDDSCLLGLRQLGPPITKWRNRMAPLHEAQVNNGPTATADNLLKFMKRIKFGFASSRIYRIGNHFKPPDPSDFTRLHHTDSP